MKRRTAFETALVRRVAKKSDFLRYIGYELGLDRLRVKRMERLGECINLTLADMINNVFDRGGQVKYRRLWDYSKSISIIRTSVETIQR
jgi:U3 small nucleolar RNA-associated protein 6